MFQVLKLSKQINSSKNSCLGFGSLPLACFLYSWWSGISQHCGEATGKGNPLPAAGAPPVTRNPTARKSGDPQAGSLLLTY